VENHRLLSALLQLLIRFLARGFGRFFIGSVTSLTSWGSAYIMQSGKTNAKVNATRLEIFDEKRLCIMRGSPCAHIQF
jgi:hypothetical protein